jgi:hypothetical protein
MVVLALAAAGCDSPVSPSGPEGDLEAARRKWARQVILNYRFTVNALCFCIQRGPLAVTVEQGRVTSLTDPVTGAVRPYPHPAMPLTVDDLFATIEQAMRDGADEVAVRYHPQLGYPEEIAIDYIEHAIDDEVTYTASGLVRTD